MTVQLIDVSNHQDAITWTKTASFAVGAFMKASEGVTYLDPYFEANRAFAKSVGVHPGAYHFARPDKNPGVEGAVNEANFFCDVVGTVYDSELRPALDMETKGPELESWARTFNQQVKFRLGVVPLFYTYYYFVVEAKFSAPIGNGLWLADYGVNDGDDHGYTVPAPWTKIAAHQYTSKGRVPGVRGYCDLNVAESLQALCARAVPFATYVDRYVYRRNAAALQESSGV